MRTSVREKADTVATWRQTAVHLMETLARWVPTSPELEAKALFGRHIWDFAQIADQLGRRTAELRLALHQSRPPVASYQAVLDAVALLPRSADRIDAFYGVVLPDYERRLTAFLATADPILDDPTSRIAERALGDIHRMYEQRDALLLERTDLRAHDAASVERIRNDLAKIGDVVDYRPVPAGDLA